MSVTKAAVSVWKPIFDTSRRLSGRMPFLRRIVPEGLYRPVQVFFAERAVPALADRLYLEAEILPRIASGGFARVLFVGCRRYTKSYGRWFRNVAAAYWPADIDPKRSDEHPSALQSPTR